MRLPRRITIDGPAGSGKSTIGQQLAEKLGYLYLDTGAMYRAVAWLAQCNHVDITDGAALADLARRSHITISRPTRNDDRQYTVLANGQDITWEIRSAEVTQIVSTVSAHPELRSVLRVQQRELANQMPGVVMVGRDIGSVVLPEAELKIYLTASLEERARRRYAELHERGKEEKDQPQLASVIEDIERRDAQDRERMYPAHDAILITTDKLNVSQVLEVIYRYLKESK